MTTIPPMTDPDPRWQSAAEYDPAWVERHLEQERRQVDVLSEMREAVFGAQDGLTSTLAVVSTVSGATHSSFAVLVAGFASALAGVFSMAAGEYLSSKSQREYFEAVIADEELEVNDRPHEAEAEVAFLLQREGLSREASLRIAAELATNKRALLTTMVEKELGLSVAADANPLRGSLVMGASFGLAAMAPVLPYFFFSTGRAIYASLALAVLILFGMGAAKSRWTARGWLPSGAETLAIGAFAGISGYLFGTVLPTLLGVAGVS